MIQIIGMFGLVKRSEKLTGRKLPMIGKEPDKQKKVVLNRLKKNQK